MVYVKMFLGLASVLFQSAIPKIIKLVLQLDKRPKQSDNIIYIPIVIIHF